MLRRALGIVTGLLLLSSCELSHATQLVVWVRGDLGADEIASVDVRVLWPGSSARPETRSREDGSLPFDFTVLPAADGEDFPALIEVTAGLRDDREFSAAAQTTFASGRTGIVEIWLMQSCIESDCASNQVCHCGGCREPAATETRFDSSRLAPTEDTPVCGPATDADSGSDLPAEEDGGAMAPPEEGGAPDAPVGDAGPTSDAEPDADTSEGDADAGTPPSSCGALLCFEEGNFSRASAATYRTSAVAVSHAAAEELRLEDRGDGHGAVALFEGARTNFLRHHIPQLPTWAPRMLGNGPMDGNTELACTGTGQFFADDGVAPDGTQTATWIRACGDWGRGDSGSGSSGTVEFSGDFTHSLWFRPKNNTEPYYSNALILMGPTVALETTWSARNPTEAARDAWTYVSATVRDVQQALYWNVYAQAGNNPGADSVGSRDFRSSWAWGHQMEQGAFPTSLVITEGAQASRDADVLTFPSDAVPEALRTGSFGLTFFPLFASDELAEDQVSTLLSFGGADDALRLVQEGAGSVIEVRVSGSTVASTMPFAHARHEEILLVAEPQTGLLRALTEALTVEDADSAPWAWRMADLRVGGTLGGSDEAFARIAEPVRREPTPSN